MSTSLAVSADIHNQMLQIIKAKRLGEEHSSAEIYWLINYLDKIPDYQLSAWLMAVCLRGLSETETLELSRAMAFSGHVLTLKRHDEHCEHEHIEETCQHEHNAKGYEYVDKHSTGGVGDKTSLVISPVLAALGYKVSKFSGRALGHTGGTIDKLESIPGFHTDISMKQFESQIDSIGIALAAQTEEFAPADKRLYALRDKSGTVESIPLIASSVMSKKIAGGADHIILDVKVGRGAFMKNLAEATKLAKAMKNIGKALKLNVQVLLTNMDQPLGYTVGNSLEVLEAISVLKGYKNFHRYLADRAEPLGLESGVKTVSGTSSGAEQESDFYRLCIALCSSLAEPKAIREVIESGAAYNKFLDFVRAQSEADTQLELGLSEMDIMIARANLAPHRQDLVSEQDLEISAIDAEALGLIVHQLAYSEPSTQHPHSLAFRLNDNYLIDNSAGVILHAKVSDRVRQGESLLTIYAQDLSKLEAAKRELPRVFSFAKRVAKPKLIYKKI